MMKWEYLIARPEDTGHTLERELDRLGNQGWEAVSLATAPPNYWVILFERPKSN